MDKWLRNNNIVKVIALLIGVLLWVVVHLDVQTPASTPSSLPRDQTINNVSVTPVNLDLNQYSIISIDPSVVTVVLRGKDSVIRKVNTSNFQVDVDLSSASKGTHILPVRIVGLPTSVIAEVFPQTVKVTVEEKEIKEVPVTINLVGDPAPGFKVGQPIIKPNRVHVTVPTSMLDEVEFALGEVNIDQASAAVIKQVKLVAIGKNGRVIEGAINPSVVDVEVPITSPFKTMPLQIKQIGEPAVGYAVASIRQVPDQVTVYGPQELLDQLDFYDGLQIDLAELKADKAYVLDIPLKDQVIQIDQQKVEIFITVVPAESLTLEQLPITVIGHNDDYITKVTEPDTGATNIIMEGAPALLDKLNVSDIQALVDVSNLPPGRYELPINLNLAPYIKIGEQSDLTATVEITQKEAKPAATNPQGEKDKAEQAEPDNGMGPEELLEDDADQTDRAEPTE